MRKYLWPVLCLAGLFFSSHAFACNSPNPNLSAPPFVDGCPVPAAALNRLTNSANIPGVDVRLYGAVCSSTTDSTAGIQAAVNAVAQLTGGTGGTVMVACPMTISTGGVNLYAGTKLAGNGPGTGYAGMSDVPGPSAWPPSTYGSSINCTSQNNPCFNVLGPGVEISNLVLGNTEGTPPASGNYSPTVYPYIISTSCGANYAGLNIHDDMFVSVYDGIDLEGCSNYSTANSGGYITLDNLVFNVALNTAIRIHLIDYTPVRVSRIEGWGTWNYNISSLGAYVRSNLKFMDVEYCAACMFSQIETPPAKYGIWLANGTVNNGSSVTLAFVGTMDQMHFNNSCQSIVGTDTNLSVWLNLTSSIIWGDQSGFKCSTNLPMISMPSNLVYLGISNVDATSLDTLLNIGCGTPGAGACPSGATGGSAYVRYADGFVNQYATDTSTAPLIEIPSTTVLSMQDTDPLQLIPANSSTGKLFGPGYDGSSGCDRPVQVGGGINQSFNSATLSDSCGLASTASGGLSLYVGGTVAGRVGFNTTAGIAVSGPAGTGSNGQVYLKPNNGTGNFVSVGQTGGGSLDINESGIPSSPISGVGLGYMCIDNAGNHYYKSSCP